MYFNKNEKQHIIVIGGNVSGLAAASQARRNAPETQVTVLESGKHISYGTCGLPYFISNVVDDINKLFVYTPDFFEEKRKIKILTNHKVVNVNPSKKELMVQVKDNLEPAYFNYDKLIICSGAKSIELKIKGIKDAVNVFNFRNVSDALSLKEYINSKNPKKAAIIGGGSIGMLIAEALLKIGIKPVVIEKSSSIFKDFDKEISEILYKKSIEKGCEILTDSYVTSVEKNDDNVITDILVQSLENLAIDKISTDLLILSAGITANTSFLEKTSIELGCSNGIKTSPKLQTNYTNIFAAGDCCCVKNIVTGKFSYIPTANNAAKMGRIAGENATGGDDIFRGSVGTKADVVFGLEIAKTGITQDEAIEGGYNPVKITDTYSSHAKAMPGVTDITITLLADFPSGKILGIQMIGEKGVAKRIDVFATAITCSMTIDDVYNLDLSYSPGTSTVWDPVNKICGKAILDFRKRRF